MNGIFGKHLRPWQLIVLLFVTWTLGHADDTDVAAIPVTSTWGDLLKTKPILIPSELAVGPDGKPIESTIAKSISVQIGIDRDHTTAYGGVILYCLAQGVSFSRESDQPLGPFQVIVHKVGISLGMYPSTIFKETRTFSPSSYLLFTRSIPLGEAGKYLIELTPATKSSQQPKTAAKIEITAAGDPVMPWSRWSESKREDLRWSPQGGNVLGMTPTFTSMTVSNPVGGIAIPQTCTLFFSNQLPDAAISLPQLIPDQPDPDTHLKMEGDQLLVTLSQEIEIYFPDERFLTRWWVNDKPYVPNPDAVDPEASKMRSLAARVWNVKEVHFELDFRPERLGAKKGDKIGVQLLFCPEGWGYEGFFAPRSPPVKTTDTTFFSFPSNRIDFIYSGDPKNPQQK